MPGSSSIDHHGPLYDTARSSAFVARRLLGGAFFPHFVVCVVRLFVCLCFSCFSYFVCYFVVCWCYFLDFILPLCVTDEGLVSPIGGMVALMGVYTSASGELGRPRVMGNNGRS